MQIKRLQLIFILGNLVLIFFGRTLGLQEIIASPTQNPIPRSNPISNPNDPNEKITIAWYNVENLYDTIRNPLIFDEPFTPKGTNKWNTERYNQKIGNIARVLDDLRADVVGLCEVENAEVVRDLMYAQRESYNFIHRHTSDRRGVDLVLLYRPDRFYPTKITQVRGEGWSREMLVVRGELVGPQRIEAQADSCEVTFVLCHMPSLMNSTLTRTAAARSLRRLTDSLSRERPGAYLVVMGDFNANPTDYIPRKILGIRGVSNTPNTPNTPNTSTASDASDAGHLYSPFVALREKGYGSYVYRDSRQLYDFMALSASLVESAGLVESAEFSSGGGAGLVYRGRCGIFARDYLFHTTGRKRGYPLRTVDGGMRNNGFSDHLPVFLTLEFCVNTHIWP